MGEKEFPLGSELESHSGAVLVDTLSRRTLWALFLLLYFPLAYYRGWTLPVNIGIDYPSYLHAARVTFIEGRSPFGLNVFDGIPGFQGGKVQPYIYPPPSLLAFWPLAKFSIPHAQAAFVIASHLCFLGSLWVILFRLAPLPEDKKTRDLILAVSLVFILCVNGVWDTFGNGQVNFIALLFICLALAAYRQEASDWRIGLPLSIAILLKTYPVLLLLPLFFRRKYRAVTLTCVSFAIVTALAYLVLPRDVWHTWFIEVIPLGGYANDKFPAAFCWNQSINAFVMRLFQENYFSKAPLYYPYLAKPVATGLALLVIGVTALSSYRASRASDPKEGRDEDIAAFLLMTFLIAPLSWDHHLVYILPAAILAITLLFTRKVSRTWGIVLTGSLLLVAWRFPIDRLDIVSGWWTLLMSAKLYPVVILWWFFVTRRHQDSQTAQLSTSSSATRPTLEPARAGVA